MMATFLILIDTNNKSWQIGVSPIGELIITEIVLQNLTPSAVINAKYIAGVVINGEA